MDRWDRGRGDTSLALFALRTDSVNLILHKTLPVPRETLTNPRAPGRVAPTTTVLSMNVEYPQNPERFRGSGTVFAAWDMSGEVGYHAYWDSFPEG